MSDICEELHKLAHTLSRFYFPFDEKAIPLNGLCLYFENGERGHDGERIVMVGSHNGDGQLRGRLKEHFEIPNKNRSMLQKTIGRGILNLRQDPYLEVWDLDMTYKENKDKYGHLINKELEKSIEQEAIWYIRENFSFCVIEVDDKEERKALKFKIIATLAQCSECSPSSSWLGVHSPKERIKEIGLWQEQGISGDGLTAEDLERIKSLCRR